ncbi:2-octaprenyl-6-methoxyphenyl hydroxylase [Neosynechococcus sphagnicola sy1]|uniref:2-octaprenyl-6-methoxyphenyl hydroxylase n=1 Tax=Neosynechococcus sphagnicola sy1 TaxID=1497020 RepID=A0A098TN53_9CYAN|nr:FAD-dependent hydroxylase [Neosynechococcus sphagnicola]KGF73724.1 2-octaprenyl-6-methoxyphenyl hydroxylase [Neosynechococcus sphagnicola sy1]
MLLAAPTPLTVSTHLPHPSAPRTAAEASRLDYDVAIAGGGIVGLTLAAALKQSGLRVVVIEAQTQSVAVARDQAYAISLLSQRIFQGIGVWEQIHPLIAEFQQICLSDADYPHTVKFDPADLGRTEVLGYVAAHGVLLTALQDFLQDAPQVTWLCPATVVQTRCQSDGVAIEIEQARTSQWLTAQLLVAADGARSPLRQAAGIRAQGWRYWQSCIVATVQPQYSHQNIAYERFWPSGPFAILPLPGNQCRIVWTAPAAEVQALLALDDTAFLTELERRYGRHMGTLSLVGQRFAFPVQLRQSNHYVRPKLALIGDAAHCCHPVGGQGLNLGIRDAAALAEVLQTASQQGLALGDLRVLRRYERWRQRENLIILGFTDLLVRCFSNQWLPMVLLRRLGLWALQHIPLVKRLVLGLMTGLTGRVPQL